MTTLLIILLHVSFSNAQHTTVDTSTVTVAPQVKISANKDTLWLVDDATGHLIGETWKDSLPPRPMIIYVPLNQVAAVRNLTPAIKTRKKKKVG